MDNLRGAILMVLAMAGFAIEDTIIKLIADDLPTWQIILSFGVGGSAIFGIMALMRGEALVSRAVMQPAVWYRNLGELIGVLGFVTALSLTALSTASAILQATPLLVTLGAALFLGEPVGWRRWSAILIGFLGVLLILRPGLDGFDASALFAVIGVIGLALRDVATRRVAKETSSVQLSFLAFLTALPGALILAVLSGQPWVQPSGMLWLALAGNVVIGVLAYYLIVAATRIGEVSFVTPFRYSRMVFALILGWWVFGERSDVLMLLGTVIIIGSGLFTLWRERRLKAAR